MKYELTDDVKEFNGNILHRIKAIKDFSRINAGDLGGWVESEDNLSHEGDAWVYGDAKVYGDAWVYGDAKVYGNAKVCGDAMVYGNAKVCGDAWVYGDAKVCGNAMVYGNAEVYGDAWVYGNAKVCGDAWVYGNAMVYGNAKVYGDAKVCGDAEVCGNAEVYGNAKVCGNEDYIVFKNFWSSGRYFTWTRSNNMWKVGCFYGTGEELIKNAYADCEKSGMEYERIVRYVEQILGEDVDK